LELNRKYALSRQLFRSGTSIGANVREAQNAESKADFIHKMKIAAKETDETIYWLELSQFIYASNLISPLLDKATSIHKVLNRIIGSSKASLSKQS
jgi:four helix bundle protein